MNTPRIGDTVHYVPRTATHRCDTGVVFAVPEGSTKSGLSLRVTSQSGHDYTTYNTPADPGNGWEDFAPGTWHHIH